MVDRLYSSKSSADKGTLYQLKELVNQTSFGGNSKNNMKATESFFEVVLYAHIIAASKKYVSSNSNETIDVCDVARKIFSKFVKLTIPTSDDSTEETSTSIAEETEKDFVHTYAVDLLTTALL